MAELSEIKIDGVTYDIMDATARKNNVVVTGSKVGQTVRITEVDESGVPVAWEAVDFYADEKYELIGEIVANSETSIAKFTTWSDGTPINAKKIRVIIESPSSSSGAINVVYYAFFDDGTNALISTTGSVSNRFFYGKYDWVKERNLWRVYKCEANTPSGIPHGAYAGQLCETTPSMMETYNTDTRNNIVTVQVSGVSGAYFLEDTKITFMGVRA